MKVKLWSNYLDNWIKVNWIKVDCGVCSAVKENIHAIVCWGYQSHVQCATVWRIYWFYWTLFKKRQTQMYEMRLKKERHELVFRSLMNETNFLVIIIIITNIDSGSIYKNTMLLLPINKRIKTVKIIYKIYRINIRVP